MRRTQRWLNLGIYHVFIILFGVLMVYPVLWMVFSSFKENTEIFGTASLIPRHFKLDAYVRGWQGVGGVPFGFFFRNSFYYVILATIGTVFSSAVVAYGFARIKFFAKNFWFVCMLLTMMLPYQVVMIPQFILFFKLGWVNSFLPLIVPMFCGQPFFVFLMIQFIRGLPVELDESAKIDGCGRFRIFSKIIFPLISPAIITTTIFQFYWRWDDFLGPLLYLNKPRLYTVSLALRMFADPATATDWGGMFAMGTLSLVPIFIIFISFQRYLVEGISTTGLKG
ncbi:carbohydrate ABC transporter membrane protein 2 (CUT1 family) [Hydrogenispora ethanolica]|jgi:multiple sugar transport system permease protein|uniref:Carbohydrate ABC transporter membrane protein 2 (CUT1 family) n=1 Tax=Hydrogenispora ethanolica TaxID=1082276 RepID=A0A4R1RTP8_HYDET|nr:carbohydrate ABC transporter permease [Hydrogenispora ethanolica]TCL69918.1 carbohydrate ABC transporter membrane protein 2 (CUT1 family) [Hydrogenispora ethanolica]